MIDYVKKTKKLEPKIVNGVRVLRKGESVTITSIPPQQPRP